MKTHVTLTSAPSRRIQVRNWMLIEGVEMVKRPYTRLFKWKRKAWNISSDRLCAMPQESLGKALGHFLKRGGFELIPKLETHDVMHVLLGFDLTVEDEARMQFVLLGNGKRTIFCLISVLLAWLTIPECRDNFLRMYLYGRSLRRFTKWKFEYLLREPLPILKELITKTQTLSKK